MDKNKFKQYLVRLHELNARQRRKLLDEMRAKDEAGVVSETLENRISGNGLCPRCKHDQFQRWGKANGLQRHRCKNCLGTFNAVTGIPLAHLRKKEKWLEYSEAMIEGLGIRQAPSNAESTGPQAFVGVTAFCVR